MLFADDTVLCSTRRERVERKLEEWRRAMEGRGLKISRKKTEYVGCTEHQDAEIHLQGETVYRVNTFTYLGSISAEDGKTGYRSHPECKAGGRTGRECLECCATGE